MLLDANSEIDINVRLIHEQAMECMHRQYTSLL
jgi:hypothetical protein